MKYKILHNLIIVGVVFWLLWIYAFLLLSIWEVPDISLIIRIIATIGWSGIIIGVASGLYILCNDRL